jgi:hypothetical protein
VVKASVGAGLCFRWLRCNKSDKNVDDEKTEEDDPAKIPPDLTLRRHWTCARYAHLPVVVVTYTGALGAQLSDPVHRGIEFARDFLFRNSRAGLYLDLTFVDYSGSAPQTEGTENLWEQQGQKVAEQLLADGHEPGEYYGLYWNGIGAIGLLGGGLSTVMNFQGVGSGTYCLPEAAPACESLVEESACGARADCHWSNNSCQYPFWSRCNGFFGLFAFADGDRPSGMPDGQVNYSEAGLFTHEFAGHGIDGPLSKVGRTLYCAHPDFGLLRNDAELGMEYVVDGKYVGPPPHGFGTDGAWMGGSLRGVPLEDFPQLACGADVTCSKDEADSDNDGLTDTLEGTFGSLSTKPDTDDDGLSDLEEFAADLLGASDPNNPDTDGDGRPDGKDAFPLDPINTEILRGSPMVDGARSDSEGWTLLYGAPFFVHWDNPATTDGVTTRVYGAWDDDFLYLAVESEKPLDGFYIEIDGNGLDTNWLGGDLYKVSYCPGGIWPCTDAGITMEVGGTRLPFANAQSAASADRKVIEVALSRDMDDRAGEGFKVADSSVYVNEQFGLGLQEHGVINLKLTTRLPGAWVRWNRSELLFIPFKLRTTAEAAATLKQIDVQRIDADRLRVDVTLTAPAQIEVCVVGGALPLPRCTLQSGAELRTQGQFDVSGVPENPESPYRYRVRTQDFDDEGPRLWSGPIE